MKTYGIALFMALYAASPALADCDDPENPVPEEDCDGDGYAPVDGDCDDSQAEINPDAEEVCGDEQDNDCDNVVDEGCGTPIEEGELMGGSSCGQSGGGLAWLAPFALFVRRRR